MNPSLKFNCIQDFENYALKNLPLVIKEYYNSGEGEEFTIRWNRGVLKKYRILPRMLRNVSQRDLSTTILGEKVSMPIGISPTALHKLAHPEGECGSAKAAETAKTCYVLSMYSNCGMEEVAEAAPNGLKWMQIIIAKDRDFTLHIVKMAEKLGYKALVLIIDNPVYGKSKFNCVNDCIARYSLRIPLSEEYISIKKHLLEKYSNKSWEYLHTLLDDSVTWNDISWLKSVTKLPIVLKGILSPEDVKLGLQHGGSAIWVSNHGGRQLDHEPATIEALPDIIRAVGGKAEVYVDGGITKGTDVFKALALGARMVFLGKTMLWSLACGGKEGTYRALEILRQELDQTFALTGCSNVAQVTRDMIVHESYYDSQ